MKPHYTISIYITDEQDVKNIKFLESKGIKRSDIFKLGLEECMKQMELQNK